MKWEDKLVLQNSKIHGTGVFAMQAFMPKEYIGQFEGKIHVEDMKYTIWLKNPNNEMLYVLEGTGILKYLNHAKKPNAKLRGEELYALQHIQVMDEITIYYGLQFDRCYNGNIFFRLYWKLYYYFAIKFS